MLAGGPRGGRRKLKASRDQRSNSFQFIYPCRLVMWRTIQRSQHHRDLGSRELFVPPLLCLVFSFTLLCGMETQGVQTRPLSEVEPPGLEVHTPPVRWSNPYPPQSPVKGHTFSNLSFDDTASSQAQRNPFGLKPLAFGLLVAAITALVVGATVGGGVGGALSKSSASTAAATTPCAATPTSPLISNPNNFTVADPSSVINLNVNCTSLARQPYTYRFAFEGVPFHETFHFSCGEDLTDATVGTNGWLISDLAQMVTYRIEDCIAACVSLNAGYYIQYCSAVVFDAALSETYLESQANCFLKNSTGTMTISRDSRMTAKLV